MKKIKRIVPILLAICLAFSFCACGKSAQEKLIGTWQGMVYLDSDTAEDVLDALDFTEDEIAVANTDELGYVDEIVFLDNNTYMIKPSENSSIAYLEKYVDSLITACFEAKDVDVYYGGDLDAATTLEEFQAAYADLFGYDTYDELVTDFAASIYENIFDQDTENGTYEVRDSDGKIAFTVDGETEAETVEFVFNSDDSAVTITYSDMEVVYERV